MYACVIYVCVNLKTIIPVSWIYEKTEDLIRKKHYLAFYSNDKEQVAPPSNTLTLNKSNSLKENELHKIFLFKLIGKLMYLHISFNANFS